MNRTTMWTALFLLGTASTALAHGASIKAGAESGTAGGALHLTGAEFHADIVVRLALVGVLDEYELAEVTADSEGSFSLEVTIPQAAKAGQYRVVAFVDGEEEAAIEIPIMAAVKEMVAVEEEDVSRDMAQHGSDVPLATIDEITIQRSYSGVGWGVMGVVIGLAGGLGLGLARTREETP